MSFAAALPLLCVHGNEILRRPPGAPNKTQGAFCLPRTGETSANWVMRKLDEPCSCVQNKRLLSLHSPQTNRPSCSHLPTPRFV